MAKTTASSENQTDGGSMLAQQKKRGDHSGRIIGIILWVIGVALLATMGVIIHGHTATWPFELQFTNALQGRHPVPCVYHVQSRSWGDRAVDFINSLNDPLQAVVIPFAWMIVLMLFRWFLQAIFLGVAVASSGGVWFGIEKFVGRPRMTSVEGVCVHRNIAAFSFPSGHVIHDTVLYGFLLYLSFTPQVRQWRYRWVLIPFQIVAFLYILSVGYMRLEAGEHRLIDVLGGYLIGLLWLFLFIFLYRLVGNMLAEHRTKKAAERYKSVPS